MSIKYQNKSEVPVDHEYKVCFQDCFLSEFQFRLIW